MVDRFLKLVTKGYTSVGEAAIVLGIFSLVSQLLGLVRDRSLASLLGPSQSLDIYYTAFRVPDFLFISVASLASITVLLPFLASKMQEENGEQKTRIFFSHVFSAFLFLLVGLSVVLFLLMGKLAPLLAPGFDAEALAQLVSVSRILLLSPILLGLSNMLGSITQLHHKFFVYALSPVFYNLGIIFGIVVLFPRYGIQGIAIGVILGAVMHMAIQLPTIITHRFLPRITFSVKWRDIKGIVMLSLPRTLGLSLSSLTTLVLISFMSKLSAGSISIFNFAYNLQTVPVGIIGISYAVASFPTLVKSYAKDKALYIDHLITASRAILFWSIPFAVVFIVFRAHIVRIVLGTGAFSWNDTKLTAAALGLFAIGVISQNLVHLFVRAYYAEGNTRLPLLINTGAAIITIVGALGLRSLYAHTPTFAHGLTTLLRVPDIAGGAVLVFPIAFALGSIMNALILFILFCGKIPQASRLPYYRSILQSFFAAIVAGLFAYGALGALAPVADQDTFNGIFLQALIAGIVYIITWIVAQELLGNREYHGIKQMLVKKIWKTEVIVPEHEELG